MGKNERIFFFIVFFALLTFVTLGWQGDLFPSDPIPVLIYSALLMISVSSLFLENYFTRPSDVIASGIAALIAIAPLRQELSLTGTLYDAYFAYVLINVALAFAALLLTNKDDADSAPGNVMARWMFQITTKLGSGKVVFLLLFLLAAVFYVETDSTSFLMLIFYAGLVITINPKRSIMFTEAGTAGIGNEIGEVIGVQSSSMFLVKLFKERVAARLFDVVEFRYSIGKDIILFKGIVVDHYLLNGKQWGVVFTDPELSNELGVDSSNQIERNNILYKCDVENPPKFLDKFVGFVAEGSKIESIYFEYHSRAQIEEGSLIAAKVRGSEVYYQVIQATTKIQKLESKDESGLIIGTASQLGQWNKEKLLFDKYGWLPTLGSHIYLPEDVKSAGPKPSESLVGYIPGTKFPVLLNRELAVTHHTAILGVTGTGKSVFSRYIIRSIIEQGTKVICVDFTGECSAKLSDLSPQVLIASSIFDRIKLNIDWLETELAKFSNQQNKSEITRRELEIIREFLGAIQNFLDSETSIGVFELPDLSNSVLGIRYTQLFFKAIFVMAKARPEGSPNICVVLEEAHTIVPEFNSMGVSDRASSALVNSIGQIALQGRKYGVGFVVIGQRTANISKTVLTQCNTIIAFQQFDKTSSEFLSNYVGSEYAETIRSLKPRTAVAIGKAFRSGAPLIFEVPELNDDGSPKPALPVLAASGAS
ncbi:MAG: DUF87 domain-containing protein [Rhodospirillaceae bacterium]